MLQHHMLYWEPCDELIKTQPAVAKFRNVAVFTIQPLFVDNHFHLAETQVVAKHLLFVVYDTSTIY